MQLTATGTFTAGPDRDISRQVTWTSGNPVVVRVNGAGTVTSFVKGTAVITAVFSNAD
ncbi:MAG: hypothetical protein GX631_03115, partial [Dehalococcoidales bacterium]|nr:hypothetical protein [Dehalococcoidales bacterium]